MLFGNYITSCGYNCTTFAQLQCIACMFWLITVLSFSKCSLIGMNSFSLAYKWQDSACLQLQAVLGSELTVMVDKLMLDQMAQQLLLLCIKPESNSQGQYSLIQKHEVYAFCFFNSSQWQVITWVVCFSVFLWPILALSQISSRQRL